MSLAMRFGKEAVDTLIKETRFCVLGSGVYGSRGFRLTAHNKRLGIDRVSGAMKLQKGAGLKRFRV